MELSHRKKIFGLQPLQRIYVCEASNSWRGWLLFSLLTGEKEKLREEERARTANGSPEEKVEGMQSDADWEGSGNSGQRRATVGERGKGAGEGGKEKI